LNAVSAIPLASNETAVSSKQSRGGLDAQKATCERQLADWVSCVSAKTPEGKAKIEYYSSKLGDINAEIKKANDAQGQAKKAAQDTGKASASNRLSGLGSAIDTYA
jgi:hypothetical protein